MVKGRIPGTDALNSTGNRSFLLDTADTESVGFPREELVSSLYGIRFARSRTRDRVEL